MNPTVRRSSVGLAGVALCAGVIGWGTPTAGAGPAAESPAPTAVTDSVVFNDPANDPKAIENHVIGLINGAASGSVIRVSTYRYRSSTYTDALGDAADRGVTVQVVMDSDNQEPDETYFEDLRSRLESSPTADSSFVHRCSGSCAKDGTGGINHDKFFLFSETNGARNVVVQTSANMVSRPGNNSGWGAYNNAVTLVSEPTIYDAYRKRFDAMADETPTPYSTTVGDNAKAYFFPRSSGNTVVGILNNVDCSGENTSGGWGPDHLTSIHIAMYAINDLDIAKKVWALDNAGCVVHYVRTDFEDGGSHSDDAAVGILNNCSAHNGVTLDTINHDDDFLHSKYLVIDGFYDGSPNQRLVWTGSYNYTRGALRSNDEALLKLWNRPAMFDAFQANFQQVAQVRDARRQAGDGIMSPDNGTMACFEPTGEHLKVYDNKADGHRAVAEYRLSTDPGKTHDAHNTKSAGNWVDVNLTLPEDATVTFRACTYEGDDPIPGGCSAWITKSAQG